MQTNRRLILYIIGCLLLIESLFMLIPGIVSYIYNEWDGFFLFFSATITAIAGSVLIMGYREHSRVIGKCDSYIIVSSVWFVFTLFGMLPFWLSGYIRSFTDAFFETMSGFTTTGSSIIADITTAPHGLLLWRALTQWLGGMGIIVLSLALLPMIGIGGMQMFSAEGSVSRSDKLHPKITETAKHMWGIYVVLTVLETIMLSLGGMSVFDAVCHSMSTISTGGFSTKPTSIGFYDSAYIEYVVIFFMFCGGMNFGLFYAVLIGKAAKLISDDELRNYALTVVVASAIVALVLYFGGNYVSAEGAIRDSLFQIVAVLTGTGFSSCDYMQWPMQTTTILTLLMLFGGSTSSTSGGIKIMRLTIMMRHVRNELKRAMHPTAILSIRYNGKATAASDVSSVISYIGLYLLVALAGIVAIALTGYNFEDAFGLAANSLGNVGTSVGNYGPSGSLADLHPLAKWIMAALMLIGRLEIFTVILIFMPSFWKR